MKTVREKVEDWLADAPKEITVSNVHVREVSETLSEFGMATPKVVKAGYTGCLDFNCDNWEEEDNGGV